MSERETVKEEVARLREHKSALTWEMAGWDDDEMDYTIYRDDYGLEILEIDRRIAYLTREYIARGIIYEPEH